MIKIESPPRITLIGYGKMGREIETAAHELSIPVDGIIDTSLPDKRRSINERTLSNTDVCIEFTQPDAVVENIRAVSRAGKNIVVGTTGWDEHLETVRALVKDHGIGLVYASNFSLGMNLFFRIVRCAGVEFNPFDSYDCHVHEIHHARKKDAPSGTALQIARELMMGLKRKTRLTTDPGNNANPDENLHISSSRVGSVPGVHSVLFDSAADTIELRHSVRNRRGFAEGALLAASWIKDRTGFYTMEDVLNDI